MNTRTILAALDGQLGCYLQLAKLAELQHGLVRQGQTDALLALLDDRQRLLGEIARHEAELAVARRDWPAFLDLLETSERSRAGELLDRTRQLLESITRSDQSDALVLQQQKLNLGRQIGAASSARHMNRQYAASAYGSQPSSVDVSQ